MFQTRIRQYFVLFAVSFFLHGCYGYRVDVLHSDPVTEAEQQTAHAFFWGLLQSPQYIVAENCKSNAINDVYITTNYGYAFATVVSLGIWAPIDVEWRCAEQPSHDGDDNGVL